MAIKRLSARLLIGTLAAAQFALAASLSPGLAASAQDAKTRPHIDLAFCIDTTGSMQNEIDNVKAKTKEIVAKLAGGKPSPVIRVGLVAYRDRGDEYVTKVFPFTDDIDKMVKDISALKADGGGDAPEAVNEALHASVHDLKWSDDKKTLKLLFLIGDAGPKHYAGDYDWHNEAKTAIERGIQINTVGCMGLETQFAEAEGVGVFKQIAHLADGKYEPLAYRQEVASADGKKATLVSSGGRLYEMKAGASADAWKAGSSALAAEAMAVPARPVAARAKTAYMSRRMAPGMGGAAAAAPMAMDMAASNTSSREESNLADVVLSATRDAAKKKLNLDFKEK